MRVYKYVTSDRIDVLQRSCIRFTQSGALNDPFEGYPCVDLLESSLIERARRTASRVAGSHTPLQNTIGQMRIKQLAKKHKEQFLENLRTNFPLLSLTKKRNNLLMWSHYTECHRGFVIGFDGEHPYFNQQKPSAITPLLEVRYKAERIVMPKLQEMFANPGIMNDLTFDLLLTKSECWQYEEELRMFAKPGAALDARHKDGHGWQVYLFELPREVFKEVIFGHQMDSGMRRAAIEVIEAQMPWVEVYEAIPSERLFDLDIRPVARERTP